MKTLTSLLAMLVIAGTAPMVQAQTATTPAETALTEDDCKKQENKDKDACAPFLPVAGGGAVLGGLGAGTGALIGVGALALVALAGGSSGSHSGSH